MAFTANGTASDQLTIINDAANGAGQTNITGNQISIGGVVIGTFSGGSGGADLVITFTTNNATPAAVQDLVRHIAYSNSSDNPSVLAREVTFTLVDGDGTANSGTDTGAATATINVTAVNDAPTVTTGNVGYDENTTVAVDSGLGLTDPDSTMLKGPRSASAIIEPATRSTSPCSQAFPS